MFSLLKLNSSFLRVSSLSVFPDIHGAGKSVYVCEFWNSCYSLEKFLELWIIRFFSNPSEIFCTVIKRNKMIHWHNWVCFSEFLYLLKIARTLQNFINDVITSSTRNNLLHHLNELDKFLSILILSIYLTIPKFSKRIDCLKFYNFRFSWFFFQ